MKTKLKDLSTNITEEVPNKVNQNWNDVVEPKQENIRNIIQDKKRETENRRRRQGIQGTKHSNLPSRRK